MNGSRRKRGNEDYVFVDGRAMRADEVVQIDLRDASGGSDTIVPGQGEVVAAPGEREAKRGQRAQASADATSEVTTPERPADSAMRRGMRGLRNDDALGLTPEAQAGEVPFETSTQLMQEDRHTLHVKYLICGLILIAVVIVSMCMSFTRIGTWHSPVDVIMSIGAWFRLTAVQISNPAMYSNEFLDVSSAMPYYTDCISAIWIAIKYIICGAMLAVSGMLFQNTFRNPIAAPSMLGISNGMNFALLILVLQFGYAAVQHVGLYYIYSAIGGIAVLILVILGGNWISGKGRFNTVNMILMGTVISQLLGVILTYAQGFLLSEDDWEAYYLLQNATGGVEGIYTYVTLFVGAIVAILPIFLFRFRFNLISFSDDESRLLGVNPNRMRVIALGCGSIMLLVAQLVVGQVAMMSLIIPFIVRSVFGSEFRKQLGGNLLIGALVMVVCGDVGTLIMFDNVSVGVGAVVQIVAIPMFIWILAIQQRSWE